MVEKNKEYVQAARVIGISPLGIMRRHLLPNVLGPVLVLATINIATAIITEATLSFLGVGVPPTQPSLGTLIRVGNDFLFSGEWWITIFPGAALVIMVLVDQPAWRLAARRAQSEAALSAEVRTTVTARGRGESVQALIRRMTMRKKLLLTLPAAAALRLPDLGPDVERGDRRALVPHRYESPSRRSSSRVDGRSPLVRRADPDRARAASGPDVRGPDPQRRPGGGLLVNFDARREALQALLPERAVHATTSSPI